MISDDREFRQQLKNLDDKPQRVVAGLLVENVLELNGDDRVKRAVKVAKDEDTADDVLRQVFNEVKKATIESRARCDINCDWNEQAAHFVSKAASAAIAPEDLCKAQDRMWQVVVSCRMARSFALIALDDDSPNPEPIAQYRIFTKFVESKK